MSDAMETLEQFIERSYKLAGKNSPLSKYEKNSEQNSGGGE